MVFTSNKFKCLVDYKSGYTWSKEQENKSKQPGSVRVLTVTNVQEKLDLTSELYLTDVSEKDKKNKAVSKCWSIAVSSNGNRKRIGNAVYISDDTDYLFASFLTGFIPKKQNKLHPKYFYYWFSSHPVQERISAVSEGTTGLGNLDIRFLRNMDIEFPDSLFEQQAITGVLTKVDEAIEAVENSIKASERLNKSFMQNLLTGKLKPDGTWRHDDEFYVDEKFGKVPIGWTVETVKSLSTQVVDGEHHTPKRSESGFYLLSARNIKNGYLDLSNVDYVGEQELRRIQKRCNPRPGDILISCSGTIGNVCVVPDGLDAGMVRSAALVKLDKDNLEPHFAEIVFQSFFLQNQMKVSVSSSVQGNLFQGAIKKLKFFYPKDKQERSDISNTIKSVTDSINLKKGKVEKLIKLKKSLMQHLLTGKVRLDVEKINKMLKEAS